MRRPQNIIIKKHPDGCLLNWWARRDLVTFRDPAITSLKTSFQELLALRIATGNSHPFGFKHFLTHQFKNQPYRLVPKLVGKEGLEPSRLIQSTDFKSAASTDSATRPGGTYGSRTRLRGFADLCVTAPPRRHYLDNCSRHEAISPMIIY